MSRGSTWLLDGRGCAAEISQTHPLIISRVYTQTLYFHLIYKNLSDVPPTYMGNDENDTLD